MNVSKVAADTELINHSDQNIEQRNVVVSSQSRHAKCYVKVNKLTKMISSLQHVLPHMRQSTISYWTRPCVTVLYYLSPCSYKVTTKMPCEWKSPNNKTCWHLRHHVARNRTLWSKKEGDLSDIVSRFGMDRARGFVGRCVSQRLSFPSLRVCYTGGILLNVMVSTRQRGTRAWRVPHANMKFPADFCRQVEFLHGAPNVAKMCAAVEKPHRHRRCYDCFCQGTT